MTIRRLLPLAGLVMLVLPAQAFAAPKPKVNFSRSAYAVAENDPSGAATITVSRRTVPKASLNQSVLVDYATSDGTAKAGTDYSARSGTVTFPSCSGTPAASDPCVQQTFTVPIIDNSVVDGARTVNLKLSHPRTAGGGRAMLSFPSAATLVIADDDGNASTGSAFQMAVASDIVQEPQTSGSEPVFIVRSGDLSQTTSVGYSTADGSALAGTDYTATSGTANFASGSGADAILFEVDVPLRHNSATDPTRDFTFNLSPPGSPDQLGSPSSEDVTIVNSDGTPTLLFSAPSYSTAETAGSVRLTVIASGSITGSDEVDVDYATADGSALAGVNYTASSDTLQFFAGDVASPVDVPVLDDGQAGDKSFTVGLSNPTAGGVLGTPSTATVNVLNTDSPGGGGGATGGPGGTTGGDQGSQIVLGTRQAACGLTVKAAKKQRLLKQKVLKLTLRAAQGCKATVTTTIKQVRASSRKRAAQGARALRLAGKKASLTLQPGKAATVRVKFTRKTLAAIAKALRARKQLVATVVVTTRDSASKVNHKTLKITIRR